MTTPLIRADTTINTNVKGSKVFALAFVKQAEVTDVFTETDIRAFVLPKLADASLLGSAIVQLDSVSSGENYHSGRGDEAFTGLLTKVFNNGVLSGATTQNPSDLADGVNVYFMTMDGLNETAVRGVKGNYKLVVDDDSLMMWMDGADASTYDLNSDGYVTSWRSKGYYNDFYVGGATGLTVTSSSLSAHLIPSNNGILGNGAYLKSFNGSFMVDSSMTCFLVFDWTSTHNKNIFGHYDLSYSAAGNGMAIGRAFPTSFSWDTWSVYNDINYSFSQDTKYVYTITHDKSDTSSTKIWLHDQLQTLASQTGVPYLQAGNSDGYSKMGLFCGHSTSPFGGHIYELIWYNRRLADDEILEIQNYLINKHDVPALV